MQKKESPNFVTNRNIKIYIYLFHESTTVQHSDNKSFKVHPSERFFSFSANFLNDVTVSKNDHSLFSRIQFYLWWVSALSFLILPVFFNVKIRIYRYLFFKLVENIYVTLRFSTYLLPQQFYKKNHSQRCQIKKQRNITYIVASKSRNFDQYFFNSTYIRVAYFVIKIYFLPYFDNKACLNVWF